MLGLEGLAGFPWVPPKLPPGTREFPQFIKGEPGAVVGVSMRFSFAA